MRIWTVERPGPFAERMFGDPPGSRVMILKTAAVGKTEMALQLLDGVFVPKRAGRAVMLIADEVDPYPVIEPR